MNGVPLRRVNQSYVIATSTVVDISGVKVPDHLNDAYFARPKVAAEKKDDETFLSTEKSVSRTQEEAAAAGAN